MDNEGEKEKKKSTAMTTITVDFNKLRFREQGRRQLIRGLLPGAELCLALFLEMLCIPLLEFFNTPGGINKFLFSCKKRMTG